MSIASLQQRYAANVTITAGAIVTASTTTTGSITSLTWDDTAKTLTVALAGGGLPIAASNVRWSVRSVTGTAATTYVLAMSNSSTSASYVFEVWNLAATPAVATPNGIAFEIVPILGV